MRLSSSTTWLALEMSIRKSGVSRGQKVKNFKGEGPNWILIIGGALLSTLSIRLGYKLKQLVNSKQQANANSSLEVNGNCDSRRSSVCCLHTNSSCYTHNADCCFECIPANNTIEAKLPLNGQIVSESDTAFSIITVPPAPEFDGQNGVIWASSPDRLELPPKPFHHRSTCSDSLCVSETGSDIFSKRELIRKLRLQLKRRDETILEMQDQILEMQNLNNAQMAHSSHLQSQLDATNRDLFDSGKEVEMLRKAFADHCVGHMGSNGKASRLTGSNGDANGYVDGESGYELLEKGSRNGERVRMLKKEVGELKELMDGKEFLLQSYKEQKAELSLKIGELQQRSDFSAP